MKTYVSISDSLPSTFKPHDNSKNGSRFTFSANIKPEVITFHGGYQISSGKMHCLDVEVCTPEDYDKLCKFVEHYADYVDRAILHAKVDEMFIKSLSFKRFMLGA